MDDKPQKSGASPKKIRSEDILKDLRKGVRTKDFLTKYRLSLTEFEQLLKQIIREGLFTVEEFKAWKARRPAGAEDDETTRMAASDAFTPEPDPSGVSTFVLEKPEKNHTWALQLFSTAREKLPGAKFKVNLHGKKYSFAVLDIVFRGQVEMLNMYEEDIDTEGDKKQKREKAIEYITKHGWSAYLERRAFTANFSESGMKIPKKGRLVLLSCKNDTYLAALHTPTPAINLYVASSVDKIKDRLAKSIDTTNLKL